MSEKWILFIGFMIPGVIIATVVALLVHSYNERVKNDDRTK